ncbi:ABC transporter permease [Aliivibrio sp. S3MY1]|uniref:ABC transporter permease n=1 Tax=unclassified Aliivibrio TaxID=2645654 RepID=UPI0023780415|nr:MULTISPECIES: ABC transporter permease [unclassified Aliivibrio]MDD9196523.1 ABC transporter permease [Aliivibrio sp. S3MY1]MDD9199237.1 ABC transporter permease [Aliivibrio sp. S2MY1]
MFKAMLIKEFLLVGRDKHALAALFIMPAVFILIMSLALKDVMNEDKSLMTYALVDNDQSSSSEALINKLSNISTLTKHALDSDEYRSPEEEGVQFIIDIPEGFYQNELPLQISVAADTSPSLLTIFKNQIALSWMGNKLDEVNSANQDSFDFLDDERVDNSFDESSLMEIQYAKLSQDEKPTSTQQSVPSWIVFGLFFVIIPMSTIFISERKQNTLMRLSTMNLSLAALFGGKILPYMLINQVQVWLMISVGMYIVPLFGAAPLTIGGSVLGLILVSLSLSLSAIGLSILIATMVDSIEQATTIGGIINILLGAIGGVMVPKFVMPEAMQTFSNISPMSWGLEGFLDIFLRRGSVMDVLNEVMALTLFGVVSLLIASIVFTYKQRKSS